MGKECDVFDVFVFANLINAVYTSSLSGVSLPNCYVTLLSSSCYV